MLRDDRRAWEEAARASAHQINPGDSGSGNGRWYTIQGVVKGPALVLDVVVQGHLSLPYVTVAGKMVWVEGGPPCRMPIAVPAGECLQAHGVTSSQILYEVQGVAKLAFGKYSGTDIEDVPEDYLRWLKDQANDRIKEVDAELDRRALLAAKATGMLDRIVSEGYRALAKKLHPDQGGDQASFLELRAANEQLKVVLKEVNRVKA